MQEELFCFGDQFPSVTSAEILFVFDYVGDSKKNEEITYACDRGEDRNVPLTLHPDGTEACAEFEEPYERTRTNSFSARSVASACVDVLKRWVERAGTVETRPDDA